jgi:hypothetical protein
VATYPTPPKPKRPRSKPRSSGGSSGGGRTRSSGGSSRPRSSGGSSSDPYAKARRDAQADQRRAESKASARLTAQAARLKQQADALKLALGSQGFKAELNRQLANSNLEFSEKDALVLSQYNRGKGELEKQAATTEDNRTHALGEAGSNAGRERSEALQQGIANGISASDMIKAQAASLRNWSFNTSQAQTNYTDEINGLQSEHSQMVNSVITSRQSAWRDREQQRSQLYRSYYDNRGQALTEVGNKLGESAQYYDMAYEQVASRGTKAKAKTTNAEALKNLRAAALETGKGYKELATPSSILKWSGTAKIKNTSDPRQFGKQELTIKDAQGASKKLRKWEG